MTEQVKQPLLVLPPVGTLANLKRGIELTGQTLKLMIGVGDYDAYVQHMQAHHPDAPVMSYKDWYRNRVDARYGASKDGAMKRCPC